MALITVALGIVTAADAAERSPLTEEVASIGRDESVSVTRGSVTLRNGRRLAYTARAGSMPLVNDATGETTAHVYFVAYTVDQSPDAQPRPLTFIFPGGPGSPATLSSSAPRVVEVSDGKAKVVNNPDTLLAATDMVLVDPVGTGYSRITKPEYAPLFYSIEGDRDSLVEVMRIYLQRYDLAESPLFLSGGSWGSVRSILVADAAIKRGIPIRGIMVSAEGASLSLLGTDTAYMNLIPGFAVIAQAHGKLPPDLQPDRSKAIAQAKAWAADVYLPALAKGNRLSKEESHKIAVQMSRYSGLKPEVIESYNLKVGAEAFTNELLRDEGKSVGFYDTRITGAAQTGAYDATKDPSLVARGVAYPSLAERHLLNRELGMVSNNYYAGPFGGGWPVREGYEDWMAIKWGFSLSQEPVGEGVEVVLPTLLRIIDGGVRVLIGMGYYDWACPPFGADYVATRVPFSQKDRIRVVHYESGHSVPPAQFAADAAALIADVLKEPRPPMPKAMVH
jgi:carboxypeptidase C (cathepsin A)